jgi:hypothetical protein
MLVVTIPKILYSTSGVETWVTSDGRAYFVRLEEDSQTDEIVVDLDNEVEPSDRVSMKFCYHSAYMLKISFIQRTPKLTGVIGVKTRTFLPIARVRYKTNIVGKGLASITSKFLGGCRSLGRLRVTAPAAEPSSIMNHVEP